MIARPIFLTELRDKSLVRANRQSPATGEQPSRPWSESYRAPGLHCVEHAHTVPRSFCRLEGSLCKPETLCVWFVRSWSLGLDTPLHC
jgi:hypothetical protein